MKLLSILIVLIISINSYAQKLMYKGEFVDTLKISSNSSFYHFDSCGTTSGVYDEYIIVFNQEENNYILNPYQRTKYKITFKPATSTNIDKIIKKGNTVNPKLISNVLKQFEFNYIKPTSENIDLSYKQFLKLTNKKSIIGIAKKFNSDWYFEKEYSTKQENKEIFNGCQNTDTFNLYLATNYDTSSYVYITDADYHFDVIISTTLNRYRFEGKYPNSFKQPWYNFSEKEKTTSILNFSINKALVDILPNKFSYINSLKPEALTTNYIKWYLSRQGMIF